MTAEYLSVIFSSTWKQGFPPPPDELDPDEEDVLFVSALEVMLEHR